MVTAFDSMPFRGREPGKAGAESSSSGLLPLLGGVLKGEDRSLEICEGLGARLGGSLSARDMGLLAILGFSDRLIGGGMALKETSLLISPDLRGGGGEGGTDGDNFGDNLGELFGSKCGV
jgi:hypothetical protein